MPAPEAGSQVLVDVLELLTLDDEEILARHGRWYIPRRDPLYLRRNALVILGNIGPPRHPPVAAALSRALVDPEALLRAHAVWAAARLGQFALLAPVADDDHPWVRQELDRVGDVPGRDAGGSEVTV
jgi:epoxyqueuosine reductase